MDIQAPETTEYPRDSTPAATGRLAASDNCDNCQPRSFGGVGRAVKKLEVNECRGDLDLAGNWGGTVRILNSEGLRRIPPGFSCKGDLTLHSCRSLHTVEGEVGGNLKMVELWGLSELPAGLWVHGDLSVLSYPSHRDLTLGCHVGGNFYGNGYSGEPFSDMRTCAVEKTTDSFRVDGDVDLGHAKRLKSVRGMVGGDLNLDRSSVRVLDEDLEVRGNLCARDCHLLGKIDCKVGGMTDASGKRLARNPSAMRRAEGKNIQERGMRRGAKNEAKDITGRSSKTR